MYVKTHGSQHMSSSMLRMSAGVFNGRPHFLHPCAMPRLSVR